MKILITGSDGLVGSHLVNYLTDQHRDYNLLTPDLNNFNLLNPQSVTNFIGINKPELIIHFAAYTDVSKAQEEITNENGFVWKINVTGVQQIVKICKSENIPLIHISTDMVFSGSSNDPGPYDENHPSENQEDKLCWYGWTKKKAEDIITSSLTNFTILRISNPVRHTYTLKPDYIKKILETLKKNKEISLFTDQYLTLTFIDDVSSAIERLINKPHSGFIHISSSNLFTPYDLGIYLKSRSKLPEGKVLKSSLDSYVNETGRKTRYLKFGGLKVTKSGQFLDMHFPSWQRIIDNIT
ncbi:hypothetical protein A3C23_00715 [Candidatus Roizmanbacteria bacterium RIFCSPHIGHO2_02_FULL_37_13b]|uniref:dTDP-4-dehydrorhamnose reductase n=1 Tax=Candidatus Roizmanbacteria bacterium RIFCSPLOWO2_02_FULL_36_11 TaxID=1802071 RepID=A0A1F7JD29_9BACT|nr:MAG: hypothetical protein A3C23_00715 [Candidatus Roizmanbacteria bacterium RIFCSPHIGHO2_02_FULL_37_13b]OGK53519.1 MAG: hypothetical protein A3H78_04825 [Candidatus Roizmanbacteria bacterium RIFCSPLOWO2_02_FULL_36_11]